MVLLMTMMGGSFATPAALANDAHHAAAVVQDIDPAAQEAVAVVEAFSAAIKGVRIDEASALLDPTVLVLESGGSERNRDQYLAEHAQADAQYMKDARQALRSTNRAYLIEQGKVVQSGSSDALAQDPTVIAHYLGQAQSVAGRTQAAA